MAVYFSPDLLITNPASAKSCLVLKIEKQTGTDAPVCDY